MLRFCRVFRSGVADAIVISVWFHVRQRFYRVKEADRWRHDHKLFASTARREGVPSCARSRSLNPKMVVEAGHLPLTALDLVEITRRNYCSELSQKAVANVTIVYGDSKWEASAGTSFDSVLVLFTHSRIVGESSQQAGSGKCFVTSTIVPFAAANFRISDDLGSLTVAWRSASLDVRYEDGSDTGSRISRAAHHCRGVGLCLAHCGITATDVRLPMAYQQNREPWGVATVAKRQRELWTAPSDRDFSCSSALANREIANLL